MFLDRRRVCCKHHEQETLMYLLKWSFNELNFRKWWIISFLEVISHLSTLHSLPRLHFTSSWWMDVPLPALAAQANHVCCWPSALTHLETKQQQQRRGREGWKNKRGLQNSTAREAFKRLRWKEVLEEGSHTSFHIPPSLCSVILPCSVAAALIASRFSKGRSISGGSVPRLHLIPFWTFVVAENLIKKHLIATTCRQWMNDEWSYSIVARHWSKHTQYRWM